jgi:MFS transporter, MCT family, solute carrier family 16 (monocarboxylic acid transporters), member 10
MLFRFNSWGLVNAYGTFQSYYGQHMLAQSSPILLNLIGASQCFFVLFLSFAQGKMLDAGYSRTLLGLGSMFVALGLFTLSVANPSGGTVPGSGRYGLTFLTQGVILSIGMSFFFIASSQIAATWFPKRKTAAVGIVACGASIAGLVYPFATKELLKRIGFNNAVRVDAAISTATCIFAFLFATPNPGYPVSKPKSWIAIETWVDAQAWRNKAYRWFVAAVASMFLGFYAIFFNLEAVRTLL